MLHYKEYPIKVKSKKLTIIAMSEARVKERGLCSWGRARNVVFRIKGLLNILLHMKMYNVEFWFKKPAIIAMSEARDKERRLGLQGESENSGILEK